jgi:hypothetical protein
MRRQERKKFNVLCVSYINTNSLSFCLLFRQIHCEIDKGDETNLLGGFFSSSSCSGSKSNLLVDGKKRGAKATDRNLQERIEKKRQM